MKINYRILLGVLCVLSGIAIMIYSEQTLHHYQVAETTKPFFQRVQDFFVRMGDSIKGTAIKAPEHPLRMKIILGIGAAVGAAGVLLLLFPKRKK